MDLPVQEWMLTMKEWVDGLASEWRGMPPRDSSARWWVPVEKLPVVGGK